LQSLAQPQKNAKNAEHALVFCLFAISAFSCGEFFNRLPDDQQHGERLRHPVTGVAFVLDREDFRAVALALAQVGIARLEHKKTSKFPLVVGCRRQRPRSTSV
jgi:hypothetical protein